MDLKRGDLFIHKHEGLSLCGGVGVTGYAAYRIRENERPVWYWNNVNWPLEQPYKKGDWLPITQSCKKTYIGCDVFYINDFGFIQFGVLVDEVADALGIDIGEDFICYMPRQVCKRLEWLENRKPILQAVV